jgi:predicted transcriptional regulator
MRQEGKKGTSSTVSGRVPASLRRKIDAIAEAEKRSVSNIVEMALEYLAQQYEEIHPQFKEDLLAGLAQLDAGEVMPYERG